MKRLIGILLAIGLWIPTLEAAGPVKVLVDDFENIGFGTKWVITRFEGTQLQLQICSDKTGGHDGKACASITLGSGERLEIARPAAGLLPGPVSKVGLWVKGNKTPTKIRIHLTPGSIELATLDFDGWKYLEKDVPAQSEPVQLTGITFDASDAKAPNVTAVAFDDLTITTAATPAAPVHMDLEQWDPLRTAHDGESVRARLKLQNLTGDRQRFKVEIGVKSGATVVQTQSTWLDLGPAEAKTWDLEYVLPTGVYCGYATVGDGSHPVLREQRVEYRVFPRQEDRLGRKSFEVLASELSPFVLIRNDGSSTKLFQGLEPFGLSGPTHVAYIVDHKVKVASTREPIETANMTESWMLFWYAGGAGWDKIRNAPYRFDVPILVVLQKMPAEIKPAGSGLEFVFPKESGYIALVPFHGTSLVRAEQTEQWIKAFPQDVFLRCRLLAEISREYPIQVQEQFKIHPGQDRVLVRNRFEFLSIDDDWATGHRKVAPLEHRVALANRYKFRLLNVSGKVLDLDTPVGQGLFAGIEGEECSYTLTGLLRYVNTIEQSRTIPTDHPLLAEARKNFNWAQAQAAPTRTSAWDLLTRASATAKVLSYADKPAQQSARLSLAHAVNRAFDPRHLSFQFDRERNQLFATEASLPQASPLAEVAAHAGQGLRHLHDVVAATRDYSLVRDRWDLVRSLYSTSRMALNWGGSAYSANGGHTFDVNLSATVSFARLAYWAGDEDAYKFACYHAAKQLLALWTIGSAYPKWVKEKNLWSSVAYAGLDVREENGQILISDPQGGKPAPSIDLENLAFSFHCPGNVGLAPAVLPGLSQPSDATLRFMKDRMLDYARHFLDELPKKYVPQMHQAAYVDQAAVPQTAVGGLLGTWLSPVLRPRLDEWDLLMNSPLAERSARRERYWKSNGGVQGHEWEIILAGIEPKYVPLWQGGAWTPKPDTMYRDSLTENAGERPACAAAGVETGKNHRMLQWLGLQSPQCPSETAGGMLPLGAINP